MKCFTYADELKKYAQESEYDTTLNYAPKALFHQLTTTIFLEEAIFFFKLFLATEKISP